jgi:hypothetical protein
MSIGFGVGRGMRRVVGRGVWSCAAVVAFASSALGQFSAGPDVIYSDVQGITNWGSLGGVRAYSLGSHTCNIGDTTLVWGFSVAGSPGLAMNAYRLSDGRLEQIGLGWVKTACCAGNGPGCLSLSCTSASGTGLKPGCRDVYGSSYNGGQSRLAPRSYFNAWTGALQAPQNATGLSVIDRRLQVAEADLVSGGQYFVEGVYVGSDDAAAGNQNNNASYKRVLLDTTSFNLTETGVMNVMTPAIYAWRDHGLGPDVPDPRVRVFPVDVPDEGRFYAASKATPVGEGWWRYDYAVFNLNSHRSGESWRVPVRLNVRTRNVSVRSPRSHSGEVFDNVAWGSARAEGKINWACADKFVTNPNANAIRWGTMFNFSFEAAAAPEPDNAQARCSLGLFRPGAVPSVNIAGLAMPGVSVCPADFDNGSLTGRPDGGVTIDDLTYYLGLYFAGNLEADLEPDTGQDRGVTIDDLILYLGSYSAGC